MKTTGVESARSEPTVFGAVRRYRVMVLVVALVAMVAGIGYTLAQTKIYRAYANVTVPQPASLQGQQMNAAQYLDSQVLLLQSQDVAQRAASIANRQLGSATLTASDFAGVNRKLTINPPLTATPGAYGASIVALWFEWPSARIAQTGANAVLQAFDETRSASIVTQAHSTVSGIDQTLKHTTDAQQRGALLTDQAQTLANEQINLASPPTLGWAVEPTASLNGGWKRAGAIGLVIGIVLGAALAYARATRRRGSEDRQDPTVLDGSSTRSLDSPTEPADPTLVGSPQLDGRSSQPPAQGPYQPSAGG